MISFVVSVGPRKFTALLLKNSRPLRRVELTAPDHFLTHSPCFTQSLRRRAIVSRLCDMLIKQTLQLLIKQLRYKFRRVRHRRAALV
jgi:hypothetical protein